MGGGWIGWWFECFDKIARMAGITAVPGERGLGGGWIGWWFECFDKIARMAGITAVPGEREGWVVGGMKLGEVDYAVVCCANGVDSSQVAHGGRAGCMRLGGWWIGWIRWFGIWREGPRAAELGGCKGVVCVFAGCGAAWLFGTGGCVRSCVRACVRACVDACVGGEGGGSSWRPHPPIPQQTKPNPSQPPFYNLHKRDPTNPTTTGGPHLERLAATARPDALSRYPLTMPLANGAQRDSCNFSFSGLKTQVCL